MSMEVMADLAKSGGSEAEKQYPIPDNLWCSITNEVPTQKPPIEPTAHSREAETLL